MTADLSTPARQALIALMIRAEKVSNPELKKHYRVEVTKAARDELTDAKLITCEVGARRAIFHELTDEGWVRARQEFTAPPPAKVLGGWAPLLYATLRHLDTYLSHADLQLADLYTAPPKEAGVEERIRGAYTDLAGKPGALIPLALIRDRLDDVPRAEQDRALHELDRRREIYLESDPGRNELTPQARAAAIRVGGEDLHLIRIGHA